MSRVLLKELEYSVGVQLFHHQKGRFNPTREAEILFEEVERSFVGLKAIKTAAGFGDAHKIITF